MTSRAHEAPTPHAFASHDGLRIFGHLSAPPGPGPHPVVVVHTAERGGALDADGRYAHVAEHAPLVAAGFAVFTVDQRGASGHGEDYERRAQLGGADVDDVIAAARYVAHLPTLDARRVAALGTSRGAYVGLLALTRAPELFRAAVLIMGFYEPMLFVEREQRVRPTTALLLRAMPSWDVVRAWFADARRQPLRHLDGVPAPLYAIHGRADDYVTVEHARRLQAAADDAGVALELDLVQDLGHDVRYEHPVWPRLWSHIAAFLQRAMS